jgi:hypothetical protein
MFLRIVTLTEIYKLSASTNAPFYTLCILPLICCSMFQRNCHLQGGYTSAVKTCTFDVHDYRKIVLLACVLTTLV